MNTIRTVIDWVQANPFLDFVIFFVFTYVIEVSKVKINPWTWFWSTIGKSINKEVINKIDKMDSRIGKLEARQEDAEKNRLQDKADSARARIIRGADEIRVGTKHSKEFFDNILEDINYYKRYCQTHPKYKNEKAVFAIKSIEEIYQTCLRENSFL